MHTVGYLEKGALCPLYLPMRMDCSRLACWICSVATALPRASPIAVLIWAAEVSIHRDGGKHQVLGGLCC